MDLIMKMDISLTESLCGMKKTIETLDARTLVIQTVPGTARLLARDVLGLVQPCCPVPICSDPDPNGA